MFKIKKPSCLKQLVHFLTITYSLQSLSCVLGKKNKKNTKVFKQNVDNKNKTGDNNG